MSQKQFSIGQCASLACLLEATAPKPGNVHRGADFEDLTFTDLAISGLMIAPAIEAIAAGGPVGAGLLQAIEATRTAVGTNSNLGMVLLFAPLAAATRGASIRHEISGVLGRLNQADAAAVYAAIRLAQPGGIGKVAEADIQSDPPSDLLAAMRLAQDRDLIARQYANDFAEVLDFVEPRLIEALASGQTLSDAIVQTHLQVMAAFPDSLIARKCGPAVAQQAADRAAAVLAAGLPGDSERERGLADFDFWLRSDGHRRNPGTTADLIAAGLFAALCEGRITEPFRMNG